MSRSARAFIAGYFIGAAVAGVAMAAGMFLAHC